MNIYLFYHSLLSDWNHGNAHFLRGVASELISRGHDVKVYEPLNGWSLRNLYQHGGDEVIREFETYYPDLHTHYYDPDTINLDVALNDADLVIVHEWNDPSFVDKINTHHQTNGYYQLLFHDTHHRAVSAPSQMARYNLSSFDGVLAFGKVIRDIYLENNWHSNVWTWHEAADTRVFYPHESNRKDGDLVWIGNWGDDERTSELREFLIEPVKELGIRGTVYGVRYPKEAIEELNDAGISYRGYLPNFKAPEVFAKHKLTVHVPRRPYVQKLPGIPTIRPFEALACGIPLISAPWHDTDELFNDEDYIRVRNKSEMKTAISKVLENPTYADQLKNSGLKTVREMHSCKERVDQLLGISRTLNKRMVNNRISA